MSSLLVVAMILVGSAAGQVEDDDCFDGANVLALQCGRTYDFTLPLGGDASFGCGGTSYHGVWMSVQSSTDNAIVEWNVSTFDVTALTVLTHTLGCDGSCEQRSVRQPGGAASLLVTTFPDDESPQYLHVSRDGMGSSSFSIAAACTFMEQQCANSAVIDCLGNGATEVTGTTSVAIAVDPGQYSCSTGTRAPVLYSFLSEETTNVSISTDHSATGGDTILHVYGGMGRVGDFCYLGGNATCVGYNDDGMQMMVPGSSDLTFQATAGQNYVIGVANYDVSSDPFTMTVTCLNHESSICADTFKCTDGGKVVFSGVTSSLSSPKRTTGACGSTGGDRVWYKVSTETTRVISLTTPSIATIADTVLSVIVGNGTDCVPRPDTSCIAHNHAHFEQSNTSDLSFTAEAGVEYVIGVSDYGSKKGDFALLLTCETSVVSTSPSASNWPFQTPAPPRRRGSMNRNAGEFIESIFTEPLFEGEGNVALGMGYREIALLGAVLYCVVLCSFTACAVRQRSRRRDEETPSTAEVSYDPSVSLTPIDTGDIVLEEIVPRAAVETSVETLCVALRLLTEAGCIDIDERRSLLLAACDSQRQERAVHALDTAMQHREEDDVLLKRIRSALLVE